MVHALPVFALKCGLILKAWGSMQSSDEPEEYFVFSEADLATGNEAVPPVLQPLLDEDQESGVVRFTLGDLQDIDRDLWWDEGEDGLEDPTVDGEAPSVEDLDHLMEVLGVPLDSIGGVSALGEGTERGLEQPPESGAVADSHEMWDRSDGEEVFDEAWEGSDRPGGEGEGSGMDLVEVLGEAVSVERGGTEEDASEEAWGGSVGWADAAEVLDLSEEAGAGEEGFAEAWRAVEEAERG